jgi:hypothetical protein
MLPIPFNFTGTKVESFPKKQKNAYFCNLQLPNMKLDLQIFNLIKKEEDRQASGIELIASENYVTNQVLQAL